MDALIKLSTNGDFNNICDVKCYFTCQLIEENGNYYQHNSEIKEIKKDDNLYFSYESQLVAKAKYTGEYKLNSDNENFPHGYKIKDILILKKPQEIDQTLFQGRIITYIKTDEQKNKIKELTEELREK